MSRNLRKRRKYPYYKIQTFDSIFSSWKDERVIFDSLADAQNHIEENFQKAEARIMEVHRESRTVIEADPKMRN